MTRVDVSPTVLRWARERAGLAPADLPAGYAAWEAGTKRPTVKQLEDAARRVRVPFGFFFLPEPPEETLLIEDFRTVGGAPPPRPSPELIDTLHAMQTRQAWLREYLVESGAAPLPFVGSATLADDTAVVAADLRARLGLNDGWAARHPTWEIALAGLRDAAEAIGVFVVTNGVVGNNSHRKLSVAEFRGFVLSDPYAPLVFLNGADARSARMFTLAHELAHVWLGRDALFSLPDLQPDAHAVERFCDAVAAETLVPAASLRTAWASTGDLEATFRTLARRFKVSPVVAARRALDLDLVARDDFFAFFRAYTRGEHKAQQDADGGGDFYKTQTSRVGKRFAETVIEAARSGALLFREAYQLTGLSGDTFTRYADKLGVRL